MNRYQNIPLENIRAPHNKALAVAQRYLLQVHIDTSAGLRTLSLETDTPQLRTSIESHPEDCYNNRVSTWMGLYEITALSTRGVTLARIEGL